MKGIIAFILIAAGCAVRERPPEPLPRPVIARGEVPPMAMPSYDGAIRTGVCAIRLEPASAQERGRRLAAIRSRLPAGARVELTDLGDRARRVTIPIARTRTLTRRAADRLARAFATDAADVFGFDGRYLAWAAEPPDAADRAWAIELEATQTDRPEWGSDLGLRVVMRVDARHGRLDAALSRTPLPAAPVCDGPRPPLDRARIRDAVVARVADLRDNAKMGRLDVAEPVARFDVRGHDVRWGALVAIGRGPEPRGADRMMMEAWIEAIALVDPAGETVELRPPPPPSFPADDWMRPHEDAAAALDQ